MLGYLVPGDHQSTKEGERYYNFVWYRVIDEAAQLPEIMTGTDGKARGYSIPPGLLTDRWKQHVYEEADAILPPAFKAMVHATDEPFAQAILDLTSERMVHGRVVLIGDAAFIPRPHTAASTFKAAANALGLAEALDEMSGGGDLSTTLENWELRQLRLGQMLYRQGTQAGDQLRFHTH